MAMDNHRPELPKYVAIVLMRAKLKRHTMDTMSPTRQLT